VRSFLGALPVAQRDVVERLRSVVLEEMPDVVEIVCHDALGYSPTGSPADRIVYIWPATGHVTLGFFFGSHLDDPRALLEGDGARMRHVKVRSSDTAAAPEIRSLVRSAVRDAESSLAQLHARRERPSA
jgi:hypothetical protein